MDDSDASRGHGPTQEGDQPFHGLQNRASPPRLTHPVDFSGEPPFGIHNFVPGLLWGSQLPFGHGNDSLSYEQLYVEPLQNFISSGFSVAEVGSNIQQTSSSASHVMGMAFWEDGTAMVDFEVKESTVPQYLVFGEENASENASGTVNPTYDFQFVSGCRPLDGSAAALAAPIINEEPSKSSNETRFKCKFPGCHSKGFKRNWELQRHMRKHSREETFDCPAVNCKYRGRKAFYRSDKLKAHVIAAHDKYTMFGCPVKGCLSVQTPLARDLLALHIRNHDNGACKAYWGYFKALEDCDQIRTCPVGTCSKRMSLAFLQQHIHQHDQAERSDFHTELAGEGFDSLNGYIICPVSNCQVRVYNHAALQEHFIDHVTYDPKHVRAWRDNAIQYVMASYVLWQGERIESEVICPTCDCITTRHLDLLKGHEELRQYRDYILTLYPGLISHTIFDDVMPIVHGKSERVP